MSSPLRAVMDIRREELPFALLIGVLIGTYSSIYVASTSILMLGVSKADLMPVKKEGVVDDRP